MRPALLAFVAVLLVFSTCRSQESFPFIRTTGQEATEFLRHALGLDSNDTPTTRELMMRSLSVAARLLSDFFSATEFKSWKDGPTSDYYGFIPLHMGSAVPGQPAITWEAPCFKHNSLVVKPSRKGFLLELDLSQPSSLLCSDFYLFASAQGFHFETFFSHGKKVIEWDLGKTTTDAELDDILKLGFRVLRFRHDKMTTLKQLYRTINELFLPGMTHDAVPEESQLANYNFIRDFSNIAMEKRTIQNVDVPEELVHSGDMFAILRLDGIDPMITWGVGSRIGHVTMALWMDGKLNVCETTTKDSHWPYNGIHCCPWAEWISLARNSTYNFVWLPLKKEFRDKFNETAAIAFYNQWKGIDYGFGNILSMWWDVMATGPVGNLPPPISIQGAMLVPIFLEKMHATIASQAVFWPAFNKRVGLENKPMAEVYYKGRQLGLTFEQLIEIPERDSWRYTIKLNQGGTTEAPQLICDVFVCSMWREAGLFQGYPPFQCTEMTPWDIYTLAMFDNTTALPPQCRAADPSLPFCQLGGAYRLSLGPFFNSRPIMPNMFERCPRGEPILINGEWDWDRPIGC